MNEFDPASYFVGILTGVVLSAVVRSLWTEFWKEYEARVEMRARELASTKFAEFAGIKK